MLSLGGGRPATFYPSVSPGRPITVDGPPDNRLLRDGPEDPTVGAGRPVVSEQGNHPVARVDGFDPLHQQPGRLSGIGDGNHIAGLHTADGHDQEPIPWHKGRRHAPAMDHHSPDSADRQDNNDRGGRESYPK
jgi:hypothetical protein